jgi:sialic acid synthase SpsE
MIAVGDRPVGDGAPCYVIAEAGANHDRDLETARRLVDVAADAGADAVKFQSYTGSSLYSRYTPRFDYLGELADRPLPDLLDDLALPREWQAVLAAHARDRGIHFFSSPFDRAAVDDLAALDVPAMKIASFEITDLELVEYVGSAGRPVIISTGMATLAEVADAIDAARVGGAPAVALLQCASLYPAPPETVNLRAMATMRTAFGVPVGLSDHTLGIHVAVASVAAGAELLEKHITLDRTRSGPDHPFAIEPAELAALVRELRDVEAALGDGTKRGPSGPEAVEMFTKARRSVVAASEIAAGTRITREMLVVKRPGTGIPPGDLGRVVGRTAVRDIRDDEIITWDMV